MTERDIKTPVWQIFLAKKFNILNFNLTAGQQL